MRQVAFIARLPWLGHPKWRGLLSIALAAVAAAPTAVVPATLEIARDPDAGTLTLLAPADPLGYYILESAPGLDLFSPAAIDLGLPAPIWAIEGWEERASAYFRLRRVPRIAPLDTDGDGIDDIWELEHPDGLDPLDPTDAHLDPDGDGRTYLDDYREHSRPDIALLLADDPPEVYSREVTVFNLGAPTSPIEAFSREVSVYNGEAPPATFLRDVYSRELSVFNLGEATAFIELNSREVSVFNFGSPPARIEAIGREVSVYNGESPPNSLVGETYSRETSVFNAGAPTAETEAISREITIYNAIEGAEPID